MTSCIRVADNKVSASAVRCLGATFTCPAQPTPGKLPSLGQALPIYVSEEIDSTNLSLNVRISLELSF